MRKILVVLTSIMLCVLTFPIAAIAGAAEEKTSELTMEKAITRALVFSNALEKAELDMEKAEDNRVLVPGNYYVEYSDAAEASIFAGESTRFAYEKAKKDYDAKQDEITLSTYEKYYQCLREQEKLNIKLLALDYAKQEYKVLQAKYGVGLVSKIMLDSMEAQVIAAQNDCNSSEADLESAFVSLNNLLGYNQDYRPVLVTEPEYASVDEDLNEYTRRVLGESPVLWTAEEAAKYMNRIANMNPAPGLGFAKISDEDAYKADLDIETVRDATRFLVRSLYNTIKKLEDGYVAAEQGLIIARETLRITEIKYQVGLVTQTELVKAQTDLAKAEQGLFELVCQHAFMKKVLEKPWAYLVPGTP